MFSTIGEALNFGGRRLDLIARVAWLPVLLLLIVNMASVFAYLSIIAGRGVTFTDVTTFFNAESLLQRFAAQGWARSPGQMAGVTAISLFLQTILVASFMAPLVRYAGLGERPAPGLFRAPFGVDQLLFIVAGAASFMIGFFIVMLPIAATSFYVMKYIVEAMSQTMASFPDPESLHTIEIVSSGKGIIESGAAWVFDLALPIAAAAPFAVIVWLIAFLHFHPRNRPASGSESNPFMRGVVVFIAAGALAGSTFLWMRGAAVQSMGQAADAANAGVNLTGTPIHAILIFATVGVLLVGYFNLRLFAWPGVAVCRRSLTLGPTLAVTRGWNLLRLPAILLIVGFALLTMIVVINALILPAALTTLQTLFQATETTTRLLNSGAAGEWVRPLFLWIWNFTKIAVNFLWTFFSYGVIAGLYGRLYREGEAAA
ncbi:MAG: hypothetical protein AAFW81_05285 [Pseudomonadota bacterium]